LVMPGPPQSPAQHLSADLLLRFLPPVYRRARALDPGDPLGGILEKVLRQWPLSGVLADIEAEPLTPTDFGGHPGLLFLYAERLARHERTAWFPTGPGREYVALAWAELGKDTTLLETVDPESTPQVHAGQGREDVDD
jgi:MoxR-vWA-beta-propeller ternary system domain bpX4